MLSKDLYIQNRNRITRSLLAIVLLVALFSINLPSAEAQADGPELFGDVKSPVADSAYNKPAYVSRARLVSIDLGLLLNANGNALDVSAKPEITLNLFPDVRFTGVLDKVNTTTEMGTSWTGTLNDGGYFYLVVSDGAFIAHVASTAKGIYEVSTAGNDLYRVVQIDQSRLVDEPPNAKMDPPGVVLSSGDLGPTADSGSTIDVMVVYTTAARLAEGSTAAMKARIALAVTEANQSYLNAGITPRLRLVHVQEVTYTESGNIQTDVNRLTNPSDGYLDVVHPLRNIYAADMVSLIVENGGGYCGMAKTIMATAATAFDVVKRSGCMTGYYSFGHEFGHLQGARHDTYVDSTNTPYTYGHGYVHTGASAAQRWRTVMAYNNKCSDLGYNCTRLQYWSNPTKTWLSAPMGVSNTKNYQVLNNTAYTVANFRSSKIAANFSSNFNGSASGWTPVYGTWSLISSAYYSTTGVANKYSSIQHAGTYGDITYQARLYRTGCSSCPNSLIIRGMPTSLTANKLWYGSYYFQYANNGKFSVYKVSYFGAISALKGWTSSAAIIRNGWNALKVVAVGISLKFYINGVLVFSYFDTSTSPANLPLYAGHVGISMYRDSTSTGNRLNVDSASLSTTPTADINPFEDVAPGTEIPGGNINQSP